MPLGALVSDFDGTITQNDFFSLIAERYMPPHPPDYFEQYRRGEITHVEAMQAFFQHAPTDEESLEALLRDTLPDPEFLSASDALARHGWDLIIVSAGSAWYIERILQSTGVQATVHAMSGRIVAGRGLQLEPPAGLVFFDARTGINKAAVVHEALSKYETVAFAGDGPPDLAPSLLVPAPLRFARRFLAEELTRRGERFRPFERWSQVVDAIVAL